MSTVGGWLWLSRLGRCATDGMVADSNPRIRKAPKPPMDCLTLLSLNKNVILDEVSTEDGYALYYY